MALEWTQTATVREGGRVEVILPLLREGTSVEVVVREESPVSTKKRVFGSARGQGHMRVDFEEPLDDFREYA
jgi:hypothetical protein